MRPTLVFACAHLCDERLFAAQVDALGEAFDCRVFVFREHDSIAGMADALLAAAPRALHADRPFARRLRRVRGDAPRAAPRRAAGPARHDRGRRYRDPARRTPRRHREGAGGRHRGADPRSARALAVAGARARAPTCSPSWATWRRASAREGQLNQQLAMLGRPGIARRSACSARADAGGVRRRRSRHAGRRSRSDRGAHRRRTLREDRRLRPPVDDRAAGGAQPAARRLAGGEQLAGAARARAATRPP